MQSKNEKLSKDEEQTIKTSLLLVGSNILISPLYLADSKLGLFASFLVTAGLLYTFNKTGEEGRLIQNKANSVTNFFSSNTNNIENTAKNVMHGGASYYDEIESKFSKPHSK